MIIDNTSGKIEPVCIHIQEFAFAKVQERFNESPSMNVITIIKILQAIQDNNAHKELIIISDSIIFFGQNDIIKKLIVNNNMKIYIKNYFRNLAIFINSLML